MSEAIVRRWHWQMRGGKISSLLIPLRIIVRLGYGMRIIIPN
jgi:hypothetical protein